MSGVYKHTVGLEKLQNARPDVINHRRQLTAGAVLIEFSTHFDHPGIINAHQGPLAVVRGLAYRVKTGEIIDRGIGLGKAIAVDPLPSFTKPLKGFESPQEMLRLDFVGIEEVDTREAGSGFSRGFLAVRQEPSQVFPDLEVGPGLYVNGSNDYFTCREAGHMAVALDSDPHLAGQDL